MPRVNSLTETGKVQDELKKLTRSIDHKLHDEGISYTRVAAVLNLTPQAVSQQFRNGNHITIEVLIASQMLLGGNTQ